MLLNEISTQWIIFGMSEFFFLFLCFVVWVRFLSTRVNFIDFLQSQYPNLSKRIRLGEFTLRCGWLGDFDRPTHSRRAIEVTNSSAYWYPVSSRACRISESQRRRSIDFIFEKEDAGSLRYGEKAGSNCPSPSCCSSLIAFRTAEMPLNSSTLPFAKRTELRWFHIEKTSFQSSFDNPVAHRIPVLRDPIWWKWACCSLAHIGLSKPSRNPVHPILLCAKTQFRSSPIGILGST